MTNAHLHARAGCTHKDRGRVIEGRVALASVVRACPQRQSCHLEHLFLCVTFAREVGPPVRPAGPGRSRPVGAAVLTELSKSTVAFVVDEIDSRQAVSANCGRQRSSEVANTAPAVY